MSIEKTKGFLSFSGGTKVEHWREIELKLKMYLKTPVNGCSEFQKCYQFPKNINKINTGIFFSSCFLPVGTGSILKVYGKSI